MMTIATWNVNSLRVRLPQLLNWLADNKPDIIALQETKTPDEHFPLAAVHAAGYQALFSGQKSYNGVALLSRHSAEAVITELPQFADPQKRVLAATYGNVRVVNLYVPNGASVDSEKYDYKLNWLSHLQAYLHAELERFPQLIVLGDFNIAPEDRDVYDPAAWTGKVLVSPPERAALQAIMALGFTDAFRLFEADSGHFSWWDYRAAGFRRNAGLRIDLILTSAALTESCSASYIDKEPRGWERPSDHAPVVAEFT